MAAVRKEAYVRPIKDLSVTAKRVTEQVRGRLVHHYTETFKKGSSKTVAVLVDGESLRSVLVDGESHSCKMLLWCVNRLPQGCFVCDCVVTGNTFAEGWS